MGEFKILCPDCGYTLELREFFMKNKALGTESGPYPAYFCVNENKLILQPDYIVTEEEENGR